MRSGSFPSRYSPAANSSFNYPAYTLEATSDGLDTVRWINDLVDDSGNFLKHLFAVDQTVHWANPEMDCETGPSRVECEGSSSLSYQGPVPIVTHVHGAHVNSVIICKRHYYRYITASCPLCHAAPSCKSESFASP